MTITVPSRMSPQEPLRRAKVPMEKSCPIRDNLVLALALAANADRERPNDAHERFGAFRSAADIRDQLVAHVHEHGC